MKPIIDTTRPIIQGLMRAITSTHYPGAWDDTRRSGVWECLRGLWTAGALTYQDFKWLDALSIALSQLAREAPCHVTPMIDGPGWEEVIAMANARYDTGERFEAIRKERGLQAAFDETRNP